LIKVVDPEFDMDKLLSDNGNGSNNVLKNLFDQYRMVFVIVLVHIVVVVILMICTLIPVVREYTKK
jgi:hypothetical protein